MKGKHQLPPTYLALGLLGMGLFHFLFSGPRLVGFPWRFLGVPVVVLGAALTISSDQLFKTLGTEVKPFQESSLVVTEGPYGFCRHPMYLGFMWIFGGFAVLAGTLVPLLLVPVMFWLFSVHFVIPEERHMEIQFGAEYEQYRSRVRRWL